MRREKPAKERQSLPDRQIRTGFIALLTVGVWWRRERTNGGEGYALSVALVKLISGFCRDKRVLIVGAGANVLTFSRFQNAEGFAAGWV